MSSYRKTDLGESKLYAELVESFIEKKREKAKKEAIDMLGEDEGKDRLIFDNLDAEIAEVEFVDNQIRIVLETKMGVFGVTTKPTEELFYRCSRLQENSSRNTEKS